MKFWKNLNNLIEQTLPDWRDKFLSYKDLKKHLKQIYPKEGEATTSIASVRPPNKRPRLTQGDGHLGSPTGGCASVASVAGGEEKLEKEVTDFVRLLEDEIEKFNAFFVDKEEEYIIRLKVLKDRVVDSDEELMTIGREIVDLHGEMVLLLNYSALNYTGLVKILKKYDKRSGALVRLPFIKKVLQQPFFTTEILNSLVKECETMLDTFFLSKDQLATYPAAEGKEKGTMIGTEKGGESEMVPEELAQIKYIESMYMKQTLTALEVLNKIRSGSSTVSMFSLPPLKSKGSEAAWKKIRSIEQVAK